MNYIIKRYKSSKLVQYVQKPKKKVKIEHTQNNVDQISRRVLQKPQKKISIKVARKDLAGLPEKKLIEFPIETEIQNVIKQESDHVPKIEITSVKEVVEKIVGERSHQTQESLISQFADNKFKDAGKGSTEIQTDYKVKIVHSNKNDDGKISISRKKIFITDKEKKIEGSDISCDNYHKENNDISANTHSSQSDKKENPSEAKTNGNESVDCIMDKNFNLDQTTQALQNTRRNSLGIQMLSKGIFDQLFKEPTGEDSKKSEDLEMAKEHLQTHGLWGKTPSFMPDVKVKLPKLESSDLDQHFRIIGEDQCFHYKKLLNMLIADDLPSFPIQWEFSPGWTRYNSDGSYSPVDYPECSAIVFDVEICVKEGSQPIMATAVSNKYWYSWCSEALIYPNHHIDKNKVVLKELIPLETPQNMTPTDGRSVESARVVVGHNVSFDRIRVREQYQLKETLLRFVDTMSLHIAVSGLVAEQRALLMKKSEPKIRLPWMNVGCTNSLDEVYKFYSRDKKGLDKSIRNVFVDGSLGEVREDFQNLMKYCASDVRATHKVLVKLLPMFFERFPHPVTFSGMLEMGLSFLPVTRNWEKYIEASEFHYHQVERQLNEELVKQVQATLSSWKDKEYENDPWLWNLDWAIPKAKVKKLPGYPNWYRKLCARTGEKEGTPEPENMSTSLQIVPKILKLTWSGFPLHYDKKFGWGYLKPIYHSFKDIPEVEWNSYSYNEHNEPRFPVKVFYDTFGEKTQDKKISAPQEVTVCDESIEDWAALYQELYHEEPVLKKKKSVTNKKGNNFKNIGIPGVGFIPLPHKDGAGNRVGNPLAKDFLSKIEDETLTSDLGDVAKLVLKTNKILSYWKNNRDRIHSQVILWSDHSSLPHAVTSSGK